MGSLRTPPTADLPELLGDAAELVEVLAAASHAHMLDEDERVDTLLAQVTPVMCKGLAETLRRRRLDLELHQLVAS